MIPQLIQVMDKNQTKVKKKNILITLLGTNCCSTWTSVETNKSKSQCNSIWGRFNCELWNSIISTPWSSNSQQKSRILRLEFPREWTLATNFRSFQASTIVYSQWYPVPFTLKLADSATGRGHPLTTTRAAKISTYRQIRIESWPFRAPHRCHQTFMPCC